MIDLLVFGTGVVVDVMLDYYIDFSKARILAFVESSCDSNKKKRGYKVIPINQISDYSYDYILIAADSFDTIRQQCVASGVPDEKIVGTVYHSSDNFTGIIEKANNDIETEFNLDPVHKFFKRGLPGINASYYFVANELFLNRNNIANIPNTVDAVRMLTLHALVMELKLNNVEGNVAELGVFRGDFACVINGLFPDKKLYLFDTFEGFCTADTEYEKAKKYSDPSSPFFSTSIDLVLSKMPYKEKCNVVKGYFPDSASDVNDSFSFVSIDTDLYIPTYNGLVYFYERLSRNGYILVHDFNNIYYSGVREAVMKFCREKEISYCPVADFAGSVIITK